MGNSEEAKSSKSEKPSSPVQPDQANVHVYPDWAAMQAYYGPRVAIPPYYNSAVASGHPPPPYMWAPPQPMMPPYGTPYAAAVYSHGGVYAHPAVPIGSHPHVPGVPSSPAAATPLSVETPTKSSANTDQGLMKKLKGFDGLAMSIGNGHGNVENAEGGERRLSQSADTEGSTGSDGNTSGGSKRSREGTPSNGGDVKIEGQAGPHASGEVNGSSEKVLAAAAPSRSVTGKSNGPAVSPGMTTALELRNTHGGNAGKTSPAGVPQPSAVLSSEGWLQNERELKRERRKQSNRESARRSRLRKQAETEELARKVDLLTSENVTLKSEINQLAKKSEMLKLENAALMEKLKNGHTQDFLSNNIDYEGPPAVSTENLLSRVNSSASVDRKPGEDGDLYERNSNSGAKLHQLLDTSPRADAVAAS